MVNSIQELIKCHYCHGDDCFDRSKWSVCQSQTGFCFTSAYRSDEPFHNQAIIEHKKGCVEKALLCIHNRALLLTNNIDRYMKCCHQNYCNDDHFLTFNHSLNNQDDDYDDDNIIDTSSLSSSPSSSNFILILEMIILSMFTIAIIAYVIKKLNLKRKRNKNKNTGNNNGLALDLAEKQCLKSTNFFKHDKNNVTSNSVDQTSTNGDSFDEDTSGSGKGLTLLNERTLSKEIKLMECVGNGRYGEVWRGVFHYEDVAVKIFYSRDEASYQREIEIYSNNLQKHDNILALIGCDVASVDHCTQLWLVTAYHPLGSLFDYLSNHSIQMNDMISIMTSITHGLCYLHTEKFGTKRKPAIAHRDIKSKNILMKSKNVCCIADFGLAVTKEKAGSLNIACNHRVGTKRYMAPEVLDNKFNDKDFVSYTRADIYSFALVLWEIIRRLETEQIRALPYEVPYQYKVPIDPSFDDMYKVVCIEQYRPEIPAHLESPELNLMEICRMIRESWSNNPSSRLHALRIKKSLTKLYSTPTINAGQINHSSSQTT